MILKEVNPGIYRIRDSSIMGIIIPAVLAIAAIVWFFSMPFDTSNVEFYLPIALLLGSIGAIFFWRGVTTTVDQNKKTIHFKLSKVYKKEEKTASFSDVTDVKYEETLTTSMDSRRGARTNRRRLVKINLKDNEIIVYRTHSSGTMTMALTNYVKRDAKKLADILGVNLVDNSMQGGIMNFAQSFTNTTNAFNPNQPINQNNQQNNNQEKK